MTDNERSEKRRNSVELADLLTGSPFNDSLKQRKTSVLTPISNDLISRPALTTKELTSVLKDVSKNVTTLETMLDTGLDTRFSSMQSEIQKYNSTLIEDMQNKIMGFLTEKFDTQNETLKGLINQNAEGIRSLKERVSEIEKKESSRDSADVSLMSGELNLLKEEINKLKVDSCKSIDLATLKDEIVKLRDEFTKIPMQEDSPADGASSHMSNLSELKSQFSSIEKTLEAQERYKRRSDVIFSNLMLENPVPSNLQSAVGKVCDFLKVTVNPEDLLSVKLINRNSDTNYCCLLVKFHNFETKKDLMKSYFAAKNLSNKDVSLSPIDHRIYLNDNLTSANYKIFKEAKRIFRVANNHIPSLIKSVYILKGQVWIRGLDDIAMLMASINNVHALHERLTNSPLSDAEMEL